MTIPPFSPRQQLEGKWLEHLTRPTRILFLDDDKNLVQLMEIVCSHYHIQLTVCQTIKDAVQAATLAKEPYDAMILDVRVSNGTGMDFYAVVMEKWPKTHVVFLTGWDSPDVREKIESIGPARIHRKDNVMRPSFMQALFAQWGLKPTSPLPQ